jgi:two-component system CheB/CheR fusion protein
MSLQISLHPIILGWDNITSVVDVIRNPSLILDKKNNILFTNDAFRRTFQVHFEHQENKNIFEVGDKQLNIPKLKKLLQEIIPKNGFFTDLEIHHTFPYIGEKIFLVSAKKVQEIVFLTIEDVTVTMTVAKTLADFAKIQVKKIVSLEKDLKDLKKLKSKSL